MNNAPAKKILILANHDVWVYRLRREIIEAFVAEGYEVYLSVPDGDRITDLKSVGCKIIITDYQRRGMNPFADLSLIHRYYKIITRIKPDMILSYTVKPNIYGGFICRLKNIPQIANITGTGSSFLSEGILRHILISLYKIAFKNISSLFFQNDGDMEFFRKNKIWADNVVLLPGSGVNLSEHSFEELPEDENINFLFIGRVMEIKGMDEYLYAAEIVKSKYSKVTFYIAGDIAQEKYKDVIDEYVQKDIVNYLGFQKDIKSIIKKCHCTIMPSHGGEGVPNALLESAAMGRIVIASDISGSRDVADEGINGYLFKPKNYMQLTEKIETFLTLSRNEKKGMGKAGREKIEKEFDRKIVVDAYLDGAKRLKAKGKRLP